MIKIKNQGYISLHVTEMNDLHHTARHFMHHFTSFYVTFYIISCHISYISLHTSHTSQCITCVAMHCTHRNELICHNGYCASQCSQHDIAMRKMLCDTLKF